ncbi:helix-turn-helix transcriptional regulator [[Mycobacterium] kokjensenii]|uniref:Helix-turn-helix transcriptional regulator n=1 Tax=[Mycobacterium] kokjensenii TaxID=3064287 RepID=A0ABM9L662_9MYCO|nr:helix-turn-helix transcriptional regulator [Mycolicibacter sp. MU0083]CAJ1493066.1 helix-turn-helix transcriptional regulator [Mycolicibacter sp. MU0083]
MTLAPERRRAAVPRPTESESGQTDRPVEFWSTSAIRDALQSGDIATWQLIVVALKRDPYGRTARQVEEILEGTEPFGISKALSEVLSRTRAHLEANERAEVARHMRVLIERSGLSRQEFASRVGVPVDTLASYLKGAVSPSAALMIRMRRLSDRFVKLHTREMPDDL